MKLDSQAYSQFPLGEGSVILHQDIKELFVLNTSGSQLWEALLVGYAPDAIAQQWAEHYNISQVQALLDIQSALEMWQQQGLLGELSVFSEANSVSAIPPKQVAISPCPYRPRLPCGYF